MRKARAESVRAGREVEMKQVWGSAIHYSALILFPLLFWLLWPYWALASGGPCPTGANYINPSNPSGPLITLSAMGITSCYYVSASGSDSNSGTSEASPWRHAPGMPDCTSGAAYALDNNSGNAGSFPPNTGLILRGGDTWSYSNGDLPWTWRSSGTSGNLIYVGVDNTWYSGSSWTRPILNLSGENLFPNKMGAAFIFGGSGQSKYTTVDNLEISNWSWTGACSGSCIYGPFQFDSGAGYDGNTLENAYFHGWSHTYNSGDTDGCVIVGGQSSNVLLTAFDGSDSSGGGDSCYAIYFAGSDTHSVVAYNYVYGTGNGFVGSYPFIHDNLIASIPQDYAQTTSGSYHGNAIENNVCNSPCFIYNNVILNVNPAAGVTTWDSPTASYDYFFNNVIINTTNGNILDLQTGSGSQSHGGYMYVFNNTVECGQDSGSLTSICGGDTIASSADSVYNGNHWVTNLAAPPLLYVPDTDLNNVTQTKSTANGQGYSASQTYVFSPTSGSGSTVGAGLSAATMQSLCSTISGLNSPAGTACLSDTTYGVSYNSTTHTVSSPGRTPNLRPTSGNWDAGAYQSGDPASLQPPTDVQAVAH